MEFRNAVQENIYLRRSTHAFSTEPVSREDLEFLIDCGLQAPTGRNLQPWFISCVQNQALLEKINQMAIQSLKEMDPFRYEDPNYSVFGHAPAVFFLSGERKVPTATIDCAAMAENMALAAHSIGLSSCLMMQFLHAFEGEEADRLSFELQVPFGYQVILAVAVGHDASDREKAPRDRNAANKAFIE